MSNIFLTAPAARQALPIAGAIMTDLTVDPAFDSKYNFTNESCPGHVQLQLAHPHRLLQVCSVHCAAKRHGAFYGHGLQLEARRFLTLRCQSMAGPTVQHFLMALTIRYSPPGRIAIRLPGPELGLKQATSPLTMVKLQALTCA